MEQLPNVGGSKKESKEKAPHTRILSLESGTPGEGISTPILLEIPHDFDAQLAYRNFAKEYGYGPDDENRSPISSRQRAFHDYLLKNKFAKEVLVATIREDNW